MHIARTNPLSIEAIFGKQGLLASQLDHFEFRPGQIEYARAVRRAIEHEHFLIAEAGTGTGKTLAYLVPAILSKKRVVVSTGTKTCRSRYSLRIFLFSRNSCPSLFLRPS